MSTTGRELMMPDEVMRMPEDREIVFINDLHPVRCVKIDIRAGVVQEQFRLLDAARAPVRLTAGLTASAGQNGGVDGSRFGLPSSPAEAALPVNVNEVSGLAPEHHP